MYADLMFKIFSETGTTADLLIQDIRYLALDAKPLSLYKHIREII